MATDGTDVKVASFYSIFYFDEIPFPFIVGLRCWGVLVLVKICRHKSIILQSIFLSYCEWLLAKAGGIEKWVWKDLYLPNPQINLFLCYYYDLQFSTPVDRLKLGLFLQHSCFYRLCLKLMLKLSSQINQHLCIYTPKTKFLATPLLKAIRYMWLKFKRKK